MRIRKKSAPELSRERKIINLQIYFLRGCLVTTVLKVAGCVNGFISAL